MEKDELKPSIKCFQYPKEEITLKEAITATQHPFHNNEQGPADWSVLTENISYKMHPETASSGIQVADSAPDSSIGGQPGFLPFLGYNERSPPPVGTSHPYFQPFDSVTASLTTCKTFDESTDISTTYLGPVAGDSRTSPFEIEKTINLDSKCAATVHLPNGKELYALVDTGATKAYLSRRVFDENEYLRKLPCFIPHTKRIFVANGEWVPALFIIPLMCRIGNHAFEIYPIVCQMNDQMIIGFKNVVETEGQICTRSIQYKLYNRSPQIFPTKPFVLKPNEKIKDLTFDVVFPQELSGHGVVKLYLNSASYVPHTTKVRVTRNKIKMSLHNSSDHTINCDKDFPVGILDIRSLGYFHVDMNNMQKNLLKGHEFESLNRIVDSMNEMITYTNKETKPFRDPNNKDPYPWLEPADPRRNMTDEQILDTTINLEESCLNQSEKNRVMSLIKTHKKAFSLRDKIGECPNIELNIDVIDDSPFFVRPFHIADKDKLIMDKQMNRLVLLGILSENNTSHTSPVMLITRKVTNDKRPVVDFRLLNTRIRRRNTATPLLRDVFNTLGKAKCEVMSCVDIKDAFHSIKLNARSKEFCGILPYFGSQHYRYEVLPMGLAISPAAWSVYVNTLLHSFGPDRSSFIAIMDDLLIHSTFDRHFYLIETLLKGLCSHGLKLSPKKSQLFRKRLVYMGNVFTVVHATLTVTPIRTRLEAIQNYERPTCVKDCKSFCGVVNYLSLFCPELQKLLHPIYHLTRKGVPFHWTDIQQKAFEEVKRRLCQPPVLHLPNGEGRFILYSDTSRKHAGSALWQMQKGVPRLIGYASKTLPAACMNYSVTELEMFGLLINIHSWKNELHNIEFDVAVDHRAVVFIMNGNKNPPATDRIGTLVSKLLQIPFNLYYVKGKDLILTDFLSRIRADKRDPEELIPISFMDSMSSQPSSIQQLITSYNWRQETGLAEQLYPVTTRSRVREKGLEMPKVHGHDKQIDPYKKPEHQPIPKPLPKQTPPTVTVRQPLQQAPQRPATSQQVPHNVVQAKKPTAAQIVRKKLVDRSREMLSKNKPPER